MVIQEFARRRKRLMHMMGRDSIAILPAAPEKRRNRDVEYPYRQDSDFFYLTGFPEPDAVAVLVPGRRHGEFLLFNRERSPDQEVWTGPRAGQDGACEIYAADDSFPIADIDEILPGLLEDKERVYYTMGCDREFDRHVMEWVNRVRSKSRAGVHSPAEFVSLDHLLHDMRLYKSRSELKAMRIAAEISVQAHRRAMRACRPGMTEYQIEAELVHEFMLHGAVASAYPSIVAGGNNACVLHYTANRAVLADGDLLLIDAGAEYDCYASDITRTFPVNGRFNREQRAVYEVVLAAQKAAIARVRPGRHWNDPHKAAVRTITEGLVDLRILKGSPDELIESGAYRRFYMHRTGHWLGMDVHDVGDYKVGAAWRELEPGMVLTIEPGVYIPAPSKGVARKWWGIGIRIEDDVVVTKDGCRILTDGAPKEADAIEAWMAGEHAS